MKYGILFLILGLLLGFLGINQSGWLLLLLWPAANAIAIGVSYLLHSPRLFGKRNDGSIHPFSVAFLLPYLSYLWLVWHGLRLASSESAYNRLDDHTIIGRRLLSDDQPNAINNYVDLTCEFNEPPLLVNSLNYRSFPILDASTPTIDELKSFVQQIDSLDGTTYIHCAQGHGRTGLVTAALLMHREPQLSASDAISRIQKARPQLSCNHEQMAMLTLLQNAG